MNLSKTKKSKLLRFKKLLQLNKLRKKKRKQIGERKNKKNKIKLKLQEKKTGREEDKAIDKRDWTLT